MDIAIAVDINKDIELGSFSLWQAFGVGGGRGSAPWLTKPEARPIERRAVA